MTELMIALTRLANAAAGYLETARQPLLPYPAPQPQEQEQEQEQEPQPQEQPQPRKAAAKPRKAAAAATATTEVEVQPQQPAAAPPPTLEEEAASLAEMKEVTAQYLRDTQNYNPPGRANAQAWLLEPEFAPADKSATPRLSELNHTQRLAWIARIKRASDVSSL